MAVTDLTNTMWIINETPSYSPFSSIEFIGGITYTSNNQTFSYIYLSDMRGSLTLNYERTTAYATGSGWSNTAYRTILITGGNDATNATLIAWLQANAVQQELYSKEYKYYPKADLTAIADAIRSVKGTSTTYTIDQMIETLAPPGPVTDLTNTTWYFNDSVDCETVVGGSGTQDYNLNFISNNKTFTCIYISYTPGIEPPPPRPPVPHHSILGYDDYSGGYISWEADDYSVAIDQSYRTITITRGSDVTNQDLIDWFYANATLQS